MKTGHAIMLAAALGAVALVGCGEKDESGVPQAWTKLDDHAKLDKIKNMPLSSQQKIDGINKLNVPDADKKAAIAEINAGGGSKTPSKP